MLPYPEDVIGDQQDSSGSNSQPHEGSAKKKSGSKEKSRSRKKQENGSDYANKDRASGVPEEL